MAIIRGFMPQQIPVSAHIIKPLIRFPASFAQRQGDRTVRIFFLNGQNNLAHPIIVEPAIFAALEHKGAETGGVALITTGKNIFGSQPISGNLVIGAPDTAVITVIFADIGKLHNPAEIYFLTEAFYGNIPGKVHSILQILFRPGSKKRNPLFGLQIMLLVQ
jgi:hypothetical protein